MKTFEYSYNEKLSIKENLEQLYFLCLKIDNEYRQEKKEKQFPFMIINFNLCELLDRYGFINPIEVRDTSKLPVFAGTWGRFQVYQDNIPEDSILVKTNSYSFNIKTSKDIK